MIYAHDPELPRRMAEIEELAEELFYGLPGLIRTAIVVMKAGFSIEPFYWSPNRYPYQRCAKKVRVNEQPYKVVRPTSVVFQGGSNRAYVNARYIPPQSVREDLLFFPDIDPNVLEWRRFYLVPREDFLRAGFKSNIPIPVGPKTSRCGATPPLSTAKHAIE